MVTLSITSTISRLRAGILNRNISPAFSICNSLLPGLIHDNFPANMPRHPVDELSVGRADTQLSDSSTKQIPLTYTSPISFSTKGAATDISRVMNKPITFSPPVWSNNNRLGATIVGTDPSMGDRFS